MSHKARKRAPNPFGSGRPAQARFVLRGMKSVETSLRLEAQARQKAYARRVAEEQEFVREIHTKFKQLGFDLRTASAEIYAGLRRAREEAVKRKREPPNFLKPSGFSFVGSLGVTRIPPYDYEWSWEWDWNSPSISKSATRSNGQMSFDIWDNLNQASAGAARAALGIYFRPPTQNGILLVSSTPAYSAGWGTWCVFSGAHTDGWIGLFVGAYNAADNSYAATVVNQQTQLFADDSWWHGIGEQSSNNSGFPLSAMFPVDQSHWYAIWVWCGGYINAEGWGSPFSGSSAHSSLNPVNVPSMSWSYFG